MQVEQAPKDVRRTSAALGVAPRQHHAFRTDVEGLRGVAVAAVVLYHAGIPHLGGGYVGVDVFFVISGFLITGLLLAEHDRTGRISLLAFYGRRVRRILPAATLVVVVTVVTAYVLVGVARGQEVAHDAEWVAVFLGNYHFATTGVNYFNRGAPPSPLLHYWSLGVEEQFYALWPLLLIACALVARRLPYRRKVVAVLAAGIAASFVWSLFQTNSDPSWAYFSPFTRAFELGTGALAVVSWLGMGAIVVAAVVYTPSTPFPGLAALLPVLGAAAVIVGGTGGARSGAVTLLGRRPVRFLGRISYSLYLWHWPILVLAAGYLGWSSLGLNLGLIAGACVLATLTYHLVESPVRSSAFLRSKPEVVSLLLAALLVAAVLAVSLIEIHLHTVAYHRPAQLSNPVFP